MDEEIFNRAKLGNREAFAQIFTKDLQKEMYVIAKVRLNNDDDCKDAIQETILELYKSIRNIKDFRKLRPWILKVLINKCNNIFRYNHKFETYESGDPRHLEADDQIENINNSVDLYTLLDCLDSVEKQLIILYYIKQYTAGDISDMLDLNEDSIRTKIKRAIAKIRKRKGRGDM